MLEANMLREESPKDQQKHLREFARYQKLLKRLVRVAECRRLRKK